MSGPTSPVLITRCVCYKYPFEALLPEARTAGWDLKRLMDETGCGTGCGLCQPYLRRMLATGQTIFTEVIWEDDG